MSNKLINKLIGDPQVGYLSLLEKGEFVLRSQGLDLSYDKILSYEKIKTDSILNFGDIISAYLTKFNFYILDRTTGCSNPHQVETILNNLRPRISNKKELFLLFTESLLQFSVHKDGHVKFSFNMILFENKGSNASHDNDFFKISELMNSDRSLSLNMKLLDSGKNRLYFYKYLDEKFSEVVEMFRQSAMVQIKEYLIFHEDYKESKHRLKLIYPNLSLKGLTKEALIDLLDRAPFNFVRFENLESYYYFFKDEFPSYNRSNKQILQEMHLFDKKLSKITQ